MARKQSPDRWGYLDSMVGRLGFRRSVEQSQRTLTAHRMVDTFVNAFAREGRRYRVVLDPAVGVAGTDLDERVVYVSPAPLLDPNLSVEDAGRIMIGIAAHEVGHDRDGRHTATRVRRTWPNSASPRDASAHQLSNLLDDVRIERRFVEAYEGYDGIFDPTLEYVGKTMRGAVDQASGIDVAIASVRYADWSPDLDDTEREWWQAWAELYAKTDDVQDHVRGVQAGLDHILAVYGKQSTPQTGSCLNGSTDQATQERTDKDAVTLAGQKASMQREVDQVDAYVELPTGATAEVLRRLPEAFGSATQSDPPAAVVGAVQRALDRARTGGHVALDRGHRHGRRLDDRAVHRVAARDHRLFERRTAPSPEPLLVYVMVDCSSSMRGFEIEQATFVAQALAMASRQVPHVRMSVVGWSTSFLNDDDAVGIAPVWRTGQDPQRVKRLVDLPMGSTPDADALEWAVRQVLSERQEGERAVVLMCSDGAGEGSIGSVVADGRRRGVDVRGVSLGHHMSEDKLRDRYGRNGYVAWPGSVAELAGPLGRLVGDAAEGRHPR